MGNKTNAKKKALVIIGAVVLLLVTLIGIPLLMQWLINQDSGEKGSDDGWLGFWGGYLGAIIGVLGAILILQMQLAKETEARREEKVDNTFFNLLTLFNNHLSTLNQTNGKHRDTFGEILKSIKDMRDKIVPCISNELDQYFESKYGELANILDNTEKEISNNKEKLLNGDVLLEMLPSIIKEIKDVKTIMESLKNGYLKQLIELLQKETYNTSTLKKNTEELISFKKKLLDQEKIINNLLNRSKEKIVSTAFEIYYSDIGSFLRFFHRIIKYINENVTNEEIKNDYIGFVRATLDENELLVIFYNAYYTKRGKRMREQLEKTVFFTGVYDESIEDYDPQFVGEGKLIFQGDYSKMLNKEPETRDEELT